MARSIRVAFAGASGTGKTALARALAEGLGLPLCPVGARSVAAEMGFASPYDVDAAGRRAEFQGRLQDAKLAWERATPAFVTDRSALDDLAYAIVHGVVGSGSLAAQDEFGARLERGLLHALETYDLLVVCPVEGFQRLDADPARRASPGYHLAFEVVLRGLLAESGGADLVLADPGMDFAARLARVREAVAWVGADLAPEDPA